MLRLEFERKNRRWTQTDVARRVESLLGNTSRLRLQTFISRAELGQICLTDEELAALAEIFHVSPAFMLLRPVASRDGVVS